MSEEITFESMLEEGWTDRVLAMMGPKELADGKYPKVNGLRRLVQAILGPIVSNRIVEMSYPTNSEQRSTVVCEVVVKSKLLDGEMVLQNGVADVYIGNIDGGYERFASATAYSRAEATAFRRLLCLQTVSYEELDNAAPKTVETKTLDMDAENDKMTSTQKALIEVLCGRVGVDKDKVMKPEMTGEEAKELVALLNGWQQSEELPPEEYRW